MNVEQFKPILELIHKAFYHTQPYDNFLNKVDQSNTSRQLLYKAGINIVDPEENFEIKPTLYEVYLDLINNEFIFEIGNVKVSSETYPLSVIIKMFKSNKIHMLKEPNKNDILKYLKAYRLLHSDISIGHSADLDKVMFAIQEGNDMTGSYYQKNDNIYKYLEVDTDRNSIKSLTCPTADHLAFAISGGGNIGNESMDVNELIYNIVNRRIKELSKHFNKEVLMTMLSIETGVESYEELVIKVIEIL